MLESRLLLPDDTDGSRRFARQVGSASAHCGEDTPDTYGIIPFHACCPPCAQPYLSTPVSTGSIKNRMKRRAQHFQLLYGDISSPQGQMVIPKYLSTSWLGHSRQISRSGLHSAYSAAQPQWEIQDLFYFILLHVTLLKFGVVAAARSTSRRVDAKLISSPLAAPPPSLASQASLTLLVQNPPPGRERITSSARCT